MKGPPCFCIGSQMPEAIICFYKKHEMLAQLGHKYENDKMYTFTKNKCPLTARAARVNSQSHNIKEQSCSMEMEELKWPAGARCVYEILKRRQLPGQSFRLQKHSLECTQHLWSLIVFKAAFEISKFHQEMYVFARVQVIYPLRKQKAHMGRVLEMLRYIFYACFAHDIN